MPRHNAGDGTMMASDVSPSLINRFKTITSCMGSYLRIKSFSYLKKKKKKHDVDHDYYILAKHMEVLIAHVLLRQSFISCVSPSRRERMRPELSALCLPLCEHARLLRVQVPHRLRTPGGPQDVQRYSIKHFVLSLKRGLFIYTQTLMKCCFLKVVHLPGNILEGNCSCSLRV